MDLLVLVTLLCTHALDGHVPDCILLVLPSASDVCLPSIPVLEEQVPSAHSPGGSSAD